MFSTHRVNFFLGVYYFLSRLVTELPYFFSFLSSGNCSLHLRVHNLFSCILSDLNSLLTLNLRSRPELRSGTPPPQLTHFYSQEENWGLWQFCDFTRSCGLQGEGLGHALRLLFNCVISFNDGQFIICVCWISIGAKHAPFLLSYWNTLVQSCFLRKQPWAPLAEGMSMKGDLPQQSRIQTGECEETGVCRRNWKVKLEDT